MDGQACCTDIWVMDVVTWVLKEIKVFLPLTSIIKEASAYFY